MVDYSFHRPIWLLTLSQVNHDTVFILSDRCSEFGLTGNLKELFENFLCLRKRDSESMVLNLIVPAPGHLTIKSFENSPKVMCRS